MKINALLIIVLYHAVIFVPVATGAMLLFSLIGRLAVPSSMAAQWGFGEGSGLPEEFHLQGLPFLADPWIRMPVLLAGVSVLYLTVTLLTDEEKQKQFVAFSAASATVKQRLAVHVAYRLRLYDSRSSTMGNDGGVGAATAQPQPPAAAARPPS
jgi:hypothetical protein